MLSHRFEMAKICGVVAALAVALAGPAMAQTRPQPRPQPRPRQANGPRFFVDLSFGVNALSKSFSQASVLPINQENGSLTARFAAKNGALFDVGGGVTLRRRLAVAVAYSHASSKAGADVTASIPHPLVFNQSRDIQGSISGAVHAESAVHVDLMWMVAATPGFELRAFAGPTFVTVRQDLISSITYSETYPFDTATFTGAPTAKQSKSTTGFNAGIDVTKYFTKSFGVGGILRATAASAKLDSPLGGQVKVRAGGLEAGAGVRLRF